MDFWSRLLSPLSSSGSSRKDQAKDPAKRLHRFEKEYGHLLSTWRSSSNLTRDGDAAETLEIRLQELTNILSDESRRPLPHPCIQYASIKKIYVPVGKIATTSNNEWIIKEAVLFFATLIESEEEAFVENSTFSASLTNLLVRITGANNVRLGLDTESRVVELAFNITTKIRLDDKVLPAWFKTPNMGHRREESDHDSREKFAGRTQRADFPLFYILMDYIHHEGKVGDFARTGLLYIIEAASNSTPLEQWIVESDLSTLMATGLGAQYSQLSRKLVIDHLPHDLPPILAFSDYEHPASNYEVISSCSPEFQSHLETFLSHLLFWQDVLNHCGSVDVKSTLLEHFQVIFLQQLLYPSLLESSDIDGGSSVAVLTYLRRILESVDHPDMINLILHYLLALPSSLPSDGSSSRSMVSAARKRKSVDLATMMAQKADPGATPLLFNLVDLILACLRSRNQQTIHVTLQLVSAILKRHHRYAVITLLRTAVPPSNSVHRTVGAQDQEIEYIMYLAESIGSQSNFDDAYETVLRDTMTRLETHSCSIKLVAPRVPLNGQRAPIIPDSLPGAPKDVTEHTLQPDDPLLNSLLDLLETFFLNPVETNLSVTETLVDLAVCGYMRIEGWLVRDPETYVYEEETENKDAEEEILTDKEEDAEDPRLVELKRAKAMRKCQERPKWSTASLPRVLDVLKQLEEQVLEYKRTVPRFDELVNQRREAFQTADAMLNHSFASYRPTPNQQETPDRRSFEDLSRSASPSRPSTLEGLAQRLLSELATPSRPSSPRGRKEQTRHSGGAYSTPGPRPAPPPKDYHDARSYSPTSGRDETLSSYVAREESFANQLAAFAAIDQTILSKRVGLPTRRIDPIPLQFDKKPLPEVPTAEESEAEDTKEEQKEGDEEDRVDSSSSSGVEDLATVEVANDKNTGSHAEATVDNEPTSDSPSDGQAADDQPVDEVVQDKAIDDEAADHKSVESKPTEEQLSDDKSVDDKSVDHKPTDGHETASNTDESQSTDNKSAADQSVIQENNNHSDGGSIEENESSETKESDTEEGNTIEDKPNDNVQDGMDENKAVENGSSGESHEARDNQTGDQGDGNREEQTHAAQATVTDSPGKSSEPATVSVSHVITNVLVLQSFLFELASLIQVRAGLFDEVRFV